MLSFKDKNNTRMTLLIEDGEKGELQLLDTNTSELMKIYLNQIMLLELKNYLNKNFEQTKED